MNAGGCPSLLVGMLHVGEPSVARVRERIRAQQDVDVELREFAHLPEREAHARLYATFDAADERHDALVKVDADMELVEPRLLHAIATLFVRHPGLDHVLIGVDDWFSGRRIQGMSAWRRGVRWTSPPPDLFTDLPTNTVRTKLKLMDVGLPLVLHATDPTDEQAIRYGLHRGLKAVATGKSSRIERLLNVVDHAAAAPERGRLLAVAAMELAFVDGAAATRLLAATSPADGVWGTIVERAASGDLCSSVRARLEDGTTTGSDHVAVAPVTRRTSFLRRVRCAARRITRDRDEAANLDVAQLRAEFLTLLEAAPAA